MLLGIIVIGLTIVYRDLQSCVLSLITCYIHDCGHVVGAGLHCHGLVSADHDRHTLVEVLLGVSDRVCVLALSVSVSGERVIIYYSIMSHTNATEHALSNHLHIISRL